MSFVVFSDFSASQVFSNLTEVCKVLVFRDLSASQVFSKLIEVCIVVVFRDIEMASFKLRWRRNSLRTGGIIGPLSTS